MKKSILTALRVSDLRRSTAFYEALGYQVFGSVQIPNGATLAMMNLPGDGEYVTLELSFEPAAEPLVVGNGFGHLAMEVDDLAATMRELREAGIETGDLELPGGEDGPKACMVFDPDGYCIEIVQWPAGHHGITRADFVQP
jgi:lactoylglutathione lyase